MSWPTRSARPLRPLSPLPGLLGLLATAFAASAPGSEEGEDQAVPLAPPPPLLARLGSPPDWSRLDPFQATMAREEFVHLLRHCYARSPGEADEVIRIEADRALILKQSNHPEDGWYDLRFRGAPPLPDPGPAYWRRPVEIPDLPENSTRPLEGLRIAVDPGHIGGRWVTWDDRHFKLGGPDTLEVREGEMTLMVAKILRRDLSLLGAEVHLTRETNDPVTLERVETLRDPARAYLLQRGQFPTEKRIADTAKAMFAISSEIRARGALVNEAIQPDLALCLHFDASPWPGGRPAFRSPNHLHLLINGCYSKAELAEDDTRLEMVLRILQGVYHEELRLADLVSRTLQAETRLPPFAYDGTSGKSVNENRYVWARNLLANRVFLCPVLFFEPFCMNHRETHARVQEGDYEGLREINEAYRKNLYQEYADGVTAGLVRYYRAQRQRRPPGMP
jgi:N-acetylmuramoyl-L-alanine amidase